MGHQRIEVLLEAYAVKRREADDFLAHCAAQEAELMQAIPEEIRTALARVAATRAHGSQAREAEVAQVAEQIKREVSAQGVSVRHGAYQAVYTRGRALWDDAFLQGYAATHEEILQGRGESQPSVSLRKVKEA
jgi:Fe-S cluster assembly scaffold protein SufB